MVGRYTLQLFHEYVSTSFTTIMHSCFLVFTTKIHLHLSLEAILISCKVHTAPHRHSYEGHNTVFGVKQPLVSNLDIAYIGIQSCDPGQSLPFSISIVNTMTHTRPFPHVKVPFTLQFTCDLLSQALVTLLFTHIVLGIWEFIIIKLPLLGSFALRMNPCIPTLNRFLRMYSSLHLSFA